MEQRELATNLLLDIEFDGPYSKLQFQPFLKQRTMDESSVLPIIMSHKNYKENNHKIEIPGSKMFLIQLPQRVMK